MLDNIQNNSNSNNNIDNSNNENSSEDEVDDDVKGNIEEETWDDINAKISMNIDEYNRHILSVTDTIDIDNKLNNTQKIDIDNIVNDTKMNIANDKEHKTTDNANNKIDEDKELNEYLNKWNNKKNDDDDEWMSLEEAKALREKKHTSSTNDASINETTDKAIAENDIAEDNIIENETANANGGNSQELISKTSTSIEEDEELDIDFGSDIQLEDNTNNDNIENNIEDNNTSIREEELSKEEKQKQEAEYIAKLEKEYHRKEFPEETLPEFEETECLIKDKDKYQATPIMHTFTLAENADPEYDKYVNPHYAYISDFFPVNNHDANRLIRTIRKVKNENIENASAEDIYKYWLLYLKEHGGDYHKYDWRNYNDLGEFIGREDKKLNDPVLDDYINTVNGQTIMYDEAADKVKAEEEFQAKVKQILESGQYHSDVDPELSHMFVKK